VIKIVYWSKKTTQTIEKNIAINALFGEGGGEGGKICLMGLFGHV